MNEQRRRTLAAMLARKDAEDKRVKLLQAMEKRGISVDQLIHWLETGQLPESVKREG